MEQYPSYLKRLLADLESPDPVKKQSAANELGQLTISHERIAQPETRLNRYQQGKILS